MEEYPLYPELSEEGAKEAQALVTDFKRVLRKAAEDAIGDLCCHVAPYIETDSWTNFRNELMDGFRTYDNRKIQAAYDFREIRQAILKHHREDIIDDLNADMVEEIAKLKEHIEWLTRDRHH